MALRVTRTSTTVAGAPAAAGARLHRFAIQVLSHTIIPPTNASASNSLILTQTAVSSLQTPAISSSLLVTHVASSPIVFDDSASHSLVINQDALSSLKTRFSTSTLVMGQNITRNSIEASASHSFTLSQNILAPLLKASAVSADGSSTLVLSNVAQLTTEIAASSSLLVSNTSAAEQVREVVSQFLVSNTVTKNLDRNLTVTSSLLVSQSFLMIPDSVSDCDYDPIVGGGPLANLMPVFLNPLTKLDSIRFVYPATEPYSQDITLRAPEFGDRSRAALDRIFRESTGGVLQTFRDDDWPEQETVAGQIVALKEEKAQAYLDFIVATLGKEIGFFDFEGRSFKAMMLNTTDPLVRTRDDVVDITFELEILDILS